MFTPFGLGLTDFVGLDKPTLATGDFDNLDYMRHRNACLVGYRCRRVYFGDLYLEPGVEVAYEPEQMRAEPDVDDAVRGMRRLAGDAALRHRRGC